MSTQSELFYTVSGNVLSLLQNGLFMLVQRVFSRDYKNSHASILIYPHQLVHSSLRLLYHLYHRFIFSSSHPCMYIENNIWH